MKDFRFGLKQKDGDVLWVNTDMIQEDVIKYQMGIEPYGQTDFVQDWIENMNDYEERIM